MRVKQLMVAVGVLLTSVTAIADIEPEIALPTTAVTREPANGLPTHTVFRPANLGGYAERSLPVVVWANGGCRRSHYGYISYLNGLAQHGYIVIAVGAINETRTAGSTEQPERLLAAVDWLATDMAQLQLQGRADRDRIATAGTSCGGAEALLAAKDSRIDAVLALSTGFWPEGTQTRMKSTIVDLDDITAPIMLAYGGPDDIAAPNAIANFERSDGPFLLVSVAGAGHNGLTYGIYKGDTDIGLLIESIGLAATWLDYALKGDRAAGARLLDDGCSYCTRELFDVSRKGFR
ncbi:MAG: dienelactone hydrolase family protein [Gammaproteobacteria bacterium]|nr:dienelactone hydrolase family protein [Gammaproteobacteria bacterium]